MWPLLRYVDVVVMSVAVVVGSILVAMAVAPIGLWAAPVYGLTIGLIAYVACTVLYESEIRRLAWLTWVVDVRTKLLNVHYRQLDDGHDMGAHATRGCRCRFITTRGRQRLAVLPPCERVTHVELHEDLFGAEHERHRALGRS